MLIASIELHRYHVLSCKQAGDVMIAITAAVLAVGVAQLYRAHY
jgi:hypothetical protein